MKSIAKLKDRARKHEQDENWKAAIEAYRKILDASKGDDDLELGTFNRIGDLYLRLGQTDNAVGYYEKAADKYAAAGFFNNAIALCNKVLRHRPDRPETYLKLSRLCAEQGFTIDARRWILEFAERQVRAGRIEAALEGLSDFVDSSGDPDVREFLAQQLASHGRRGEAVGHYARAYATRLARGETEAAERAAKRARDIDPAVDLDAAIAAATADSGANDLPMLEEPGDAAARPRPDQPDPDGIAGLETRAESAAGGIEITNVEGLEAAGGAVSPTEDLDAGELPGLERTGGGVDPDEDLQAAELPGLEPSSAEPQWEEAEELPGLEPSSAEPQWEEAEEPEAGGLGGLGGLETFEGLEPERGDAGAGVPPIADAGLERDTPEEEPEPLPLIDSGFEDAGGEQPDPLPLLDMGPEEAPQEEEEQQEEQEGDEIPMLELGSLDFGTPGGEPIGAGPTTAGEEEETGLEGGPLDLDLGEFASGAGTAAPEGGEPPLPVEGLDVRAVLARARELVSRGLTAEALTELRLLSGAREADAGTYRDAVVVLNEVARRQPGDLGALQQRVDFAARAEDESLLVKAYLGLAEALDRSGAATKAAAMYERVLGLDPDNAAARAALGGGAEEEQEPVDLDAILLEVGSQAPETGFAPAEEQGPGPDPEFAAMLSQFKARVTDNAEIEDAGDHYDLGIAFKEMGLIDEAIAEFQTALTGGEERLKVYEELGQCFIMKGQYTVALKIFHRALQVPHQDEAELLGVYYHLGQCHEHLGQREEARQAYGKVLAIDPSFQDVPDRMARL